MRLKKDLKKILNNQHGIALMMIMTAIILLMAIYGEFTFESKISRIKATNILDRSQAKLLAESGLQLAVTRLRLYKEAFNKIQGNANAKSMVPPQLLNQLWEVPFIYPIPIGKNANSALKETVEKFTKETLLEGEMRVSIQNISNRLNLNMLRVDMASFNPERPDDRSSQLDTSDSAILNNVSVDQSLYFLLKRLVDDKKQKDEGFEDRYGNINYQEMISTLKYYISDYQAMNQDPFAAEAEANLQRIPLTPKYGPLGSGSELYSLPGWNDELIELIQNEFSVYPSTQIDFNKLTSNMIKLIFPNITDDEIREFFLWRDDPEQPKFLNTKEDLKRYFVNQERLMDESEFDNRLKLFEDRGFSFGSNPNLFKIVSEGIYNRSNYTLVAYVVLPKQEMMKQNTAQKCPEGQTGTPPNDCRDRDGNVVPPPAQNTPTDQSPQLLEPRVIEIQIN